MALNTDSSKKSSTLSIKLKKKTANKNKKPKTPIKRITLKEALAKRAALKEK